MGGTIPSAGQQDLHHDGSMFPGPEFQQGDKVMIHGLVNKKEFNHWHGILLQFDSDAKRWAVELTMCGTRTGEQLAIKPVNLRAIPPGEEEVPEDVGSHPGAFQAHPAAPPASDGPLPAGGFPDGPGHGDASSGYTAGGTIPSAGQQDRHPDWSDEDNTGGSTAGGTIPPAAQQVPPFDRTKQTHAVFKQGDKVMIHGLENKKELNDRFGILLQFDPITQRWGVELTAFGTRTGKQLAIKPSNLRAVVCPNSPGDDDAHSVSSAGSWHGGIGRGENWVEDNTIPRDSNTRNSSSSRRGDEAHVKRDSHSSRRLKPSLGSEQEARKW